MPDERRIDELTQDEIDSRFFAVVTDLIGTPVELVGEDGALAWRSRSILWGSTVWNSDATAYAPLRFPGQYYDPETGLHYNRHRHYDPDTGHYVSPDPLGLTPAPDHTKEARQLRTPSPDDAGVQARFQSSRTFRMWRYGSLPAAASRHPRWRRAPLS